MLILVQSLAKSHLKGSPITGQLRFKLSVPEQIKRFHSTWSRGQAWGIYGFANSMSLLPEYYGVNCPYPCESV